MPARRRRQPGRAIVPLVYPDAIMLRLESWGRVAWAKWYDEVRHGQQLQQANDVLVDRIETLVPTLLELTDAVLFERNVEAFAQAHRVRMLIQEYVAGARR